MSLFVRRLAAAFAIAALAVLPASAEEGMWTFDHFPSARMQAEMGWAPDQRWLDRVMAATARLPNCSASVVSGEGLVLTNHHCVIACARNLSSADHNYVEGGFMARSRTDEQRCAGLNVQVLTGITDVTARIAAAAANVAPEGFAAARDAEMARLQNACAHDAIRCEVVTLYQGGRYALYAYKRFTDVRLVFAPERAIAAFGGEDDNFNFPRYDLDIAFLRLYENGAPAATPAHLSLRFTPLTENEIVLVAGNPGSTERLQTVSQLRFERDLVLPWRIEAFGDVRQRLLNFAAQGPEQARTAAPALQNVENSLKAFSGRRLALSDATTLAQVQARETDLQARVHRNAAAMREAGDAWGDIARAETVYRTFFYAHQDLEAFAAPQSDLFAWARDIVRGAAEREKPNAARLARYADARLPAVEANLRADRPVDAGFEAANLAAWLSKTRTHLTARDARVHRMLGGQTPTALAHALAQSRLADPAERLRLWQGGVAAVAVSTDPMIVFVRAWDADARGVGVRYRTLVEAPIVRGEERIAQARFRAFGETMYPDATFSPRLSYGRVVGWNEAGQDVAPFTRFSGLFARATNAAPFALTPSWVNARAKLNADTIFNVSSSNDIIGGNSGSPLLDREGRVVGAVFDGNIHSLGGDYFYDGASNRAVTVASTAIRSALTQVYGMDALVAELGG